MRLLTLLAVTLLATPAHAGGPPGECRDGVQPFVLNGVDWNAATGYRGWYVGLPRYSHPVPENTCWAPHAAWATDHGYSDELRATLASDGYVFAGDTPMDDFVAKLEAVTYVIDEGTANETTHLFSDPAAIDLVTTADRLGLPDPIPIQLLLPRLPTPPVGRHTVRVYYRLSADHHDGFPPEVGEDPEWHWMRAGTTLARNWSFSVVAK
jgi:hypothetical protein